MYICEPSVVSFTLLPDGCPHKPYRANPGDAGWDLFVSRMVTIPPRSFADVHTDIAIAMPPGVWGRITGRSSTVRCYGLQVQEGIIDTGYRGEMFVGVWNPGDNPVAINTGDRIAQLIFHRTVEVEWVPVQVLPDSDRGKQGFGSSGR